MFVLFLNWDLKYAGLVTNLGPVPFVPWGTTRRVWKKIKTYTTRRLLCSVTFGSRSIKRRHVTDHRESA